MGFKGNSLMSQDEYKEAIKLYAEELINNRRHSTSATEIMKLNHITVNKDNYDDFMEITNRFLGVQELAWMIHLGKVKINKMTEN